MPDEPAKAKGRKESPIKTAYRYLKSRKLALVLMICLTSAVLAAAVIPQFWELTNAQIKALQAQRPLYFKLLKATALGSVYTSWWFYALLALFLLNMILCTFERAKLTLRASANWLNDEPSAAIIDKLRGTPAVPSSRNPDEALYLTSEKLGSRGYSIARGENLLVARKWGWGRWGSVILHASFFVIALGVLVGRTTFMNGLVELAEGQSFTESHASYQRLEEGPFFWENHAGFEISLDGFTAEFWKNGKVRDRVSTISIYDGGRKALTTSVSPNYPAIYNGRTIYQLNEFGYSAILKIEKEGEAPKIGALNFKTPPVPFARSSNGFVASEIASQVNAEFSPDDAGKASTDSWNLFPPKSPALFIKVFKIRTKETIFKGTLRPGESAKIGDATLTFLEVRRWTQLLVTKDSGAWIVFLGFWMALAGIAMVYFIIPKKIWVLVDETEEGSILHLAGTTARYSGAFSESLAMLRDELASTPLEDKAVKEIAAL